MDRSAHEGAVEARIEENLEYVRRMASRMKTRLPAWVDVEELVAAGNMGLVKASMRWDPARRTKFSTYAYAYIRGAMLEGLRGEARAERAVAALRCELGVLPYGQGEREGDNGNGHE